MAFSESSYFSNSIQGVPQAGADFNVQSSDTTPRYAIGTRIMRQDGNEFVYSHFGNTVTRGVLVSADVSETSVVDTDNIVVAPASAVNTSDGTIGSKFVEITLASISADQFAGGYLATTDDTGAGYTYRIRGNTATGNPAAGNFRLELYDPLIVALDATTDIGIQGCLYQNLDIANTGIDNALAGVNVRTQTIGAGETARYGWIQTKGVVAVLQDGTIAIGDMCTLSDSVPGAIQVGGGGGTTISALVSEQLVGHCLIAGDDTGYGVFNIFVS